MYILDVIRSYRKGIIMPLNSEDDDDDLSRSECMKDPCLCVDLN